ncbi:unnamed protein product [Somion occarium]|uniref:PARP catalytic domain-containing protein n=1 Tax=Somion occarium TaxID=3059160 RepID=A0ABP1EBT0_9APHY
MSALSSLSYLAGMISQNTPPTKGKNPPKRSATVNGTSNVNKSLPQPQSQVVPVGIPATSASHTTSVNATPSSSPPTGSVNNLCEVCHIRPKFVDGSKTHPYCGRTCASKATPSPGNCEFCHARPKRFDGTRLHPYCSKSCAINAEAATRQASLHIPPHGICHIPGCSKPVYRSNGHASKYCSLAHKSLAENSCIWCRKAPKQGDKHFCGLACSDEARKKGPIIVEIPDDHVTFQGVESQFKSSWRHDDKVCPTVRRIYKIIPEQSSLDKYDAYRDAVEARGQFVQDGRSAGNENRRWHGTTRDCHLGDRGHTQFCSSSKCSLCSIMKTSYKLNLWGKKTGWGRFGAGIYTSSTSSKSNDYSSNTDPNAPLKAIILNKVVVGKGYKMTRDNTSLTAPPAGFDSVLAEKGSRLNHDELVVYTNDAIRPSYLVMYDAL